MYVDYSMIKNLPGEYDIDEKKVEEKYKEFLDWLKKDIYKKDWENSGQYNIPEKFKDIIFTKKLIETRYNDGYEINNDISKYLYIRIIINLFKYSRSVVGACHTVEVARKKITDPNFPLVYRVSEISQLYPSDIVE